MLRELIEAQEGKAIPYLPWMTDAGGPMLGSGSGYYGANNPYVNSGAISYGRTQSPIGQREASVHLQTYGGSEPVDWLFDAINFTTACATNAKYHFVDPNGGELALQKRPNDPPDTKEAPLMAIKLFEKPNPYQLWDEFLEITLIDFLLVGNAYWVKWAPTSDGGPTALYRMHPGCVKIIPDQFGPAKYLYRLPGTNLDTEFFPEQIMHIKRPNPHNPLYGLGIVKGGSVGIDMELALTRTMASYYQKRGLPSGVVQTERRVPRDVFNKLKTQLRSFYGGAENAGQLMVLEAGLKYMTISPSAQDSLFADMAGWSRDRILSLFHLNKTLMGQSEARSLAAGELDDWQRLFDTKTVLPMLNKLARLISHGLTRPAWGIDFEFDYAQVPPAPADVLQRATVLAAMPGVKVRELREAAGLPPSTGDQTVDDMILNLPGPDMGPNGTGGVADRNLPGEAGRPPKPESTQAIAGSVRKKAGSPAAVAGGTSGKAMIESILAELDTHLKVLDVKSLAPARMHVGAISDATPPEDRNVATRQGSINALSAQVEGDILKAVRALERGLLDSSEGKAAGGTMYQRIKNSKAWAAFTDKLTSILQGAAEQALSLANIHHSKQGFKPSAADYEAVAKAVIGGEPGVPGIIDTFKKEVLADILDLQQHGSHMGGFSGSIQTAIKKWEDGRAHTIALTEATRAYNEGTLQVAEENGSTHVLVSDGDTHDEPCMEANGQTWTIAEARSKPFEHPNCVRAFVPIIPVSS